MKLQSKTAVLAGTMLLVASGLFAQHADTEGTATTGSTASSISARKESWVQQADSFVPMTGEERLAHYAYSLVDPQALVYSAAQAGVTQLRDTPHEWGQGAEGYGHRLGSGYAQHVIGATVANAIAFGLHEDDRYFKSRKRGFGRLTYAITSAFLARQDDGSRVISFSAIGGTAAGAFIPRAWQPRSTASMASGAQSFGIAFGIRAGVNVAREFLPRRLERILK
jgi:hypothetical protein